MSFDTGKEESIEIAQRIARAGNWGVDTGVIARLDRGVADGMFGISGLRNKDWLQNLVGIRDEVGNENLATQMICESAGIPYKEGMGFLDVVQMLPGEARKRSRLMQKKELESKILHDKKIFRNK